MSQVLQDLLDLLKLETIEQGLYRGQSQDLVSAPYSVDK